jgi:hypothetical protein
LKEKVSLQLDRKLLDGTIVPSLDIAIELVVKTKCPGKYKLVDMETGLAYTGVIPDSNDGYFWKRTDEA